MNREPKCSRQVQTEQEFGDPTRDRPNGELMDRQELRMTHSGDPSTIGRVLIEGQFCGFASLSIVNRHLAKALLQRGLNLRILPTDRSEGDEELQRAGLAGIAVAHADPVDVHLRNAWPPVTHGMAGKRNGLVCWAWEESEIPPLMAMRFNRDLDFVMTTARYVSDALRRSGVTIPCPIVGNGADQILSQARHNQAPEKTGKRLLHISTFLPRKAPDELVEAFCRAFNDRNDVELYIKTSPNPHNFVRRVVEDTQSRFSVPPRIIIDDSTLDGAGIARLYQSATAVVLVSRGEGFGLPLAEAMHLGIPVVAARSGGQADFCTERTALLVESRPAKSKSHVASTYGLWEDPDVESFAKALQQAVDEPELTRRLSANARRLASESLTWDAVASRVISSLSTQQTSRSSAPSFEVVSTWNEECGIATYSKQLYGDSALKDGLAHIWARRSLKPTEANSREDGVTRLWGYDGVSLQRFADQVGNKALAPVIWFQHHPGHFSADDMRNVVPALRRGRDRLIITLHNVHETLQSDADWLNGFDVIVAHAAEDVEELGRAGFRGEVLPHGVRILGASQRPNPDNFVVGTFGFLTEHKNLELLVSAIALARKSDPRIHLVLANAQRVERQSRVARSRVDALIKTLKLEDHVTANYDFLPDDKVVKLLAPCDLLVFPYSPSPEGASGAARMAIALDRPTLLSNSGVFRDLLPFSHLVRNLDVETLAEAILGLAQDDAIRTLHDRARRRYAETHSWEVVGQRAANLMRIS